MRASEMLRATLPYLSTAWDFATGTLNPAITFTRASTGYRENSSGVLVSETTDVARFDYEPVAFTPRGLLIEEAATNLLTYSEDLTNAAWSKQLATISANAIAAPDGATTMDRMIEDSTAASGHYIRRSVSYVSGTTYVASFYAKAGARSWVFLDHPATAFTTLQRTYFDLTNGVVGITGSSTTAFIENVGGGIYRCSIIATATASISAYLQFGLATGDGGAIYNGDGASDAYFWGLNLTAINCATSYIQTVAATAARSSDIALATNPKAISDQCWIVKGRTPRKIASGPTNTIFQIDDGSSNNRRLIYSTSGGVLRVTTVTGGVIQSDLGLGTVSADTDFSIAARFADNNFAASINGGAIVTDTSGVNPLGLTTARVGHAFSGSYWNSTIRHIETRRTATDAELVLLST
jgi:hypothetical protein